MPPTATTTHSLSQQHLQFPLVFPRTTRLASVRANDIHRTTRAANNTKAYDPGASAHFGKSAGRHEHLVCACDDCVSEAAGFAPYARSSLTTCSWRHAEHELARHPQHNRIKHAFCQPLVQQIQQLRLSERETRSRRGYIR